MSKMGRPKAEEPMNYKTSIRFTDKEYQKLKAYADAHHKTLTETIKEGIELLYQKESFH